MRRPVGVAVAASILGIMSVLGLFGVALSFGGMFLMHNPAMQNPALHNAPGGQAALVVSEIAFACFLAFCLWTAVGLFRLRRWARYSVIVIGILTFIIFGFISALMLVVRDFLASPHFAHTAKAAVNTAQLNVVSIALIAIGAFYAVIALVGLWWAVYFNLKRVRLAFAAGGAGAAEGEMPAPSEYAPWREVVIAFICLTLLGVPSALWMAWLRLPIFLFGFFLRGNGALIACLVLAAVQIFVGIGLLARLRSAYWAAIAWQIFGILSTGLFLIPAYAARVLTVRDEINRRFMLPPQMNSMNSPQLLHLQKLFMLGIGVVSVAIFLVFLYALLRCRRWYLGGGSVVEPA